MSYWDSVKQVVGGAYCATGDFSVWYASNASAILDNTPAEGLARTQETIFRWWHTLSCGKDPDSSLPAAFEPPFRGGQCEGMAYGVTVTVAYSDGALLPHYVFDAQYPAYGKVTAVSGGWDGGGFRITAVAANRTESFITRPVGGEISNIEIFPVYGGIDNCGDPNAAGITPSGQPFSETRDIDYLDENGNPRTANGVQFDYDLPYIDPNGNISVPYEICWNGVCLTGDIEFGDGINVKPKPPFAPPSSSTSPTLLEIEALLDAKNKDDEIIDKIDEKVEEIKEEIKDIEVFASVPEAYQLRVEASRKQLIIMYAEKLPDSTPAKPKYARNRLSQSIPHWNGSKNWGNLPVWTRGNFWAKCVLADNSKIYVLADSRERAESVVNRLLTFVSSGVQNGKVITSGKLGTEKITARKGHPKYARFFPKGQETKQDDVQRFDINL